MNRVSMHAVGGGRLPPAATLAELLDRRAMPYGIALLRLMIGGLFISHLYGKFAFFGLNNWWTGLERAGYPAWVLVYPLSAEFVGAILITLGIYTRWASLYALPMMIGATLFWVQRKGFYFTGAGYELPFIWSLMLLVQALLGDGAFALASRFSASPQLARGRLTPPANRVDP